MGVKRDEVGPILDGIFEWFSDKAIDWALGSLQTLVTWWMSDSAYSVSLNGENGGTLYFLRAHTNWLTLVMAFAGFLVAAFRVAVQRKGEPFRAALSQFFGLAVMVLIMATVVNLANVGGDRYSEWILREARPKNDQWIENWKSGIGYLQSTDTMFILLIFLLAAAIGTVIQFALMLFRSGVLIVLVGVLPAVAASRFSAYGDYAYKKCLGWLISFILYKPVAATIYAAAFQLLGGDNDADRLFGLGLVAGAVFVLPAVMRAVMPAVAEDNSFFGVRQVGHFVFGGSAVNAGKLTNVMSGTAHGLQKLVGGSDGGPKGVDLDRRGASGRGGPAPRGGASSGAVDDQAVNAADRGTPAAASGIIPNTASPISGTPNGGGKGDPQGEDPTFGWTDGYPVPGLVDLNRHSRPGLTSPNYSRPGYAPPSLSDAIEEGGRDGNGRNGERE